MKIWYRVTTEYGWTKYSTIEEILQHKYKTPPIKKIIKVTEEELSQDFVDEMNSKLTRVKIKDKDYGSN